MRRMPTQHNQLDSRVYQFTLYKCHYLGVICNMCKRYNGMKPVDTNDLHIKSLEFSLNASM
jgi:hypothetical protein